MRVDLTVLTWSSVNLAATQTLERNASPSNSSANIDDEKRAIEDVDLHSRFPTVDERKLLAKIDIRLLPVLCILYLLAFLDRCVNPHYGPSPTDCAKIWQSAGSTFLTLPCSVSRRICTSLEISTTTL